MTVKNVALIAHSSFLLLWNLTHMLYCIYCGVLSPWHHAWSLIWDCKFFTLFVLGYSLQILSAQFVDMIVFLSQVDEVTKWIPHGLIFLVSSSRLWLNWGYRFPLHLVTIILVTVRVWLSWGFIVFLNFVYNSIAFNLFANFLFPAIIDKLCLLLWYLVCKWQSVWDYSRFDLWLFNAFAVALNLA